PRKTGKERIQITALQAGIIEEIKPGYVLKDWTADRLCRVCLLMHLDPLDQDRYFRTIESLFLAAEMSELVALYSALPVLAHPEIWKMRCAEGIRSNISTVLEALMYGNPYPAGHLDEKAWNQLVMKAFFTDKDVNRIYGFDERANAELALIISDYAHERWAAGRSVNPLLWRSTAKFIDTRLRSDLEKVLSEGELKEKQAAALAIYNSNSLEAKELLRNYSELVSAIKKKELTWDKV
ncbi:EboA domain-containing protein, partial [Daejeonella sp.]|uniref:EboA domain-containing protein n=1 Tax=Daejeonella sp. TaxID=2805397 RepID=UPI0030BF413E